MPQRVTSKNHHIVKKIRKLGSHSYRDQEGLFIVEGYKLIEESINCGAGMTELVYVESEYESVDVLTGMTNGQVATYCVRPDVMKYISDVVTPQGIVGVIEQVDKKYDDLSLGNLSLVLVADEVRDPGNLGALMRIADAAGADAFILSEGCVDLYNSKVVRSGAGSHFHMTIARGIDLMRLVNDFKKNDIRMIGLETRGDTLYLDADMTGPTAIFVGNEAWGIPIEHIGMMDETVYINMPGKAESLNVASAASVVVFDALRQRRQVAGSG